MPQGLMPHNVSLPRHLYCHVVTAGLLVNPVAATIPAIWIGVSSTPGRAIGCHVVLENGALVADLDIDRLKGWPTKDPEHPSLCVSHERWDAFGRDIEAVLLGYLEGRQGKILDVDHSIVEEPFGSYLFTVDWLGDGYSTFPAQHKLIHAMQVKEHFCWVPNDQILWLDPSFCRYAGIPKVIRQGDIQSAEDWEGAEF